MDNILYNHVIGAKEGMMKTVAYSAFRNNLRAWLDYTRDQAEPIVVASKDSTADVVVMNARDYDSLMETMRIYTNPYLRDKLDRGIAQFEENAAAAHDLIEDDDE